MNDQANADAKKVAYKAKLLTEQIGLAAGLAVAFAPRVHMIKAAKKPGIPHRIQLADGGWIEVDPTTRRVVTWGPGRTARDLATALKDGDDAHAVEHLEETATASAPGAPRRTAPVLSDEQARSLADRWRERGYSDITEDSRGVWVALDDGTRLFDSGTRVQIHGPITDGALVACARKARDEWDGRLALQGPGRDWSDRDKARLWLACQRQGVVYSGYEPTADLVARWEAEREAADGSDTAQALRPGDDVAPASAGPVPLMTGDGSAAEPEVKAPADKPETDLSAFDRKTADLDRRQVDLEQRQRATHKERSDYFQRTERLDLRAAQDKAFQERDELRQAEAKIEDARAILARARALAIEKGLDYKSAIDLARAEHLAEQEHGYRQRTGLRR